jgi:hypothetical protein
MNSAPRMRRKDASTYLLGKHGISRTPNTLAKYACVGGGPVFQKDGRIPLYTPEWLDDFAKSVLSPPMRSTADLPPKSEPKVPERDAGTGAK